MGKKSLWISIFCVTFFSAFVFLLPSLLSTKMGTDFVAKLISSRTGHEVKIRRMHLNWFSKKYIDRIEWKDRNSDATLAIRQVDTTSPLWEVVSGTFTSGKTYLYGVSGSKQNGSQSFYISEVYVKDFAFTGTSFKTKQSDKAIYVQIPFTGLVQFNKGEFQILQESDSPIAVKEIEGSLYSPRRPSEEGCFNLSGQTFYGDNQGHFLLEGCYQDPTLNHSITFFLEPQQSPHPESGDAVRMKVSVKDFPVKVIESAAALLDPALNHGFVAAFGRAIDVEGLADFTPERQSLSLRADSPLLHASLSGELSPESLSLSPESYVEYSITPEFASLWPAFAERFQLNEASVLNLTVNRLRGTAETISSMNPQSVHSFRLHLDLQPIHVLDRQSEILFSMNSLHGFVEKFDSDQALVISLQASQGQGQLDIVGRLKHFFEGSGSGESEWTVEAKAFPTAILDQLARMEGKLSADMGETFDLQLRLNQLKNLWHSRLKLRSDYWTIPQADFVVGNNRIELKEPFRAKARVSQQHLQKWLPQNAELVLKQPLQGVFDITSLSIPIETKRPWTDYQLNGTFQLAPMEIGFNRLTSEISQLKGTLQGHSLAASNFDLGGHVRIDGIPEPYREAFAEQAAFQLKGKLFSSDGQQMALNDVSVQIESSDLTFKAIGELNESSHFTLIAPAQLMVRDLSLRIDRAQFGLDSTLPLRIGGKLVLPEIRLPDNETLSQIDVTWNYDDGTEEAEWYASAQTGQANSIELSGQAQGWKKSKRKIHARGKGKGVPTSLIAWATRDNDLQYALGKTLNFNLAIDLDPDEPEYLGHVNIQLNGDRSQGDLHLYLTKDYILTNANQPLDFNVVLTPETTFQLVKWATGKPPAWKLEQPARLNAKLANLRYPLSDSFTLPEEIDGKMILDPISLKGVRKVELDLHRQSKKDPLNFNASLVSDKNGKVIDIEGKVQSLASADPEVELKMQGRRVPTEFFKNISDDSFELPPFLEALVGPEIDLNSSINVRNWNGTILFEARGKNGSLIVDSRVDEGRVTLNQPLVVETALTPESIRFLTQEYVPFLGTVVSVSDPIQLLIQPKGFVFDLKNPTLASLTVGEGILHLGKVKFKNDSSISLALNLLGRHNETFEKPTLSAWFTPLYFTVRQGVFVLKRIDALVAEKFPIASWGYVNFPGNRVEMTLGMSAVALKQAYGIGNLPKGYMLQLPIIGTLDNAFLDTKTSIGRITALITKSQAGPFASIVDYVAGEDTPPPPPTSPLPWGEIVQEEPKSKNGFEKQLEKGVNKIFDLFK